MGLLASKIATALVLPLGAGLGLGLVALGLAAAGRRRLAALLGGAALVGLYATATPFVAEGLAARLERRHPPVPLESTAPADAILVLGGGVAPDWPPRPAPDLGSAGDRVVHAWRLYRAGKAPRIIATGAPLPWQGDARPGGEAAAELLREWGVPEDAIAVARGRTTREECVRVAALLEAQAPDGEVLLVTSALHMRRALATCRAAGVRARPSPTDFEATEHPTGVLDFLPDGRAVDLSNRTAKEWLGWHVYRSRGWLQ